MTTLNTVEKQILEKLFQMDGGGVLNFTNRGFSEFFRDDLDIDIYADKYNYRSGSKANRMRGFWQVSENKTVGKATGKLIEYIESQVLIGGLNREDFSQDLINRAKEISARLSGVAKVVKEEFNEDDFLKRDVGELNINLLNIDLFIADTIKQRINEIQKCLKNNAPLAVIFLCGSTLEGILLDFASRNPVKFNQASSSPKDKLTLKVKAFNDWKLEELINAAKEVGAIGDDVKKFSSSLRDFRNYIHPYEQASAKFNPDIHTAELCFKVLQVAIIHLSKFS